MGYITVLARNNWVLAPYRSRQHNTASSTLSTSSPSSTATADLHQAGNQKVNFKKQKQKIRSVSGQSNNRNRDWWNDGRKGIPNKPSNDIRPTSSVTTTSTTTRSSASRSSLSNEDSIGHKRSGISPEKNFERSQTLPESHQLSASISHTDIVSFVSAFDKSQAARKSSNLSRTMLRKLSESTVSMHEQSSVIINNLRQLCGIHALSGTVQPRRITSINASYPHASSLSHSVENRFTFGKTLVTPSCRKISAFITPIAPTIPSFTANHMALHSPRTSVYKARNALLTIATNTCVQQLNRRALLSLAEALDTNSLDDSLGDVENLFELIEGVCNWLVRLQKGVPWIDARVTTDIPVEGEWTDIERQKGTMGEESDIEVNANSKTERETIFLQPSERILKHTTSQVTISKDVWTEDSTRSRSRSAPSSRIPPETGTLQPQKSVDIPPDDVESIRSVHAIDSAGSSSLGSSSRKQAKNPTQILPRREDISSEALRVLDLILERLEHYHDLGKLTSPGQGVTRQQAADWLSRLDHMLKILKGTWEGNEQWWVVAEISSCMERVRWMLFSRPKSQEYRSISLILKTLASVVQMCPPVGLVRMADNFSKLLSDLLQPNIEGNHSDDEFANTTGKGALPSKSNPKENMGEGIVTSAIKVHIGKKILRLLAAIGVLHPHGMRCFLETLERLAYGLIDSIREGQGDDDKSINGDNSKASNDAADLQNSRFEWVCVGITLLSSIAVRGRTAAIRQAALDGLPRLEGLHGHTRFDEETCSPDLKYECGEHDKICKLPDRVAGLAQYVGYLDSDYWKPSLFRTSSKGNTEVKERKPAHYLDLNKKLNRDTVTDPAYYARKVRYISSLCITGLALLPTFDPISHFLFSLISERIRYESDPYVRDCLVQGERQAHLARSSRAETRAQPLARQENVAYEGVAGGRYASGVLSFLSAIKLAETQSSTERADEEYTKFLKSTGLEEFEVRTSHLEAKCVEMKITQRAREIRAVREAKLKSMHRELQKIHVEDHGTDYYYDMNDNNPAPKLSTEPYHLNYRQKPQTSATENTNSTGRSATGTKSESAHSAVETLSSHPPPICFPKHPSALGPNALCYESAEPAIQGNNRSEVSNTILPKTLLKNEPVDFSRPHRGTANRRKLYNVNGARPNKIKSLMHDETDNEYYKPPKAVTPPIPVVVRLPQPNREAS